MVEIIFIDIDGCLSDGGLYYTNNGDEIKRFDVKDGFGIYEWLQCGKVAAIITGRTSQMVEDRARDLGIQYVFQGIKDKYQIALEILEKENLTFAQSAAIGDDFPDQKLLDHTAISFKPNDALKELRADITLSSNGGHGAVREMIEILVDRNNMRDMWLKRWQ